MNQQWSEWESTLIRFGINVGRWSCINGDMEEAVQMVLLVM